MDTGALLDALCVAERLKDTTRHCYTKNGRHESVAEHCRMMTLRAFSAYLTSLRDEIRKDTLKKIGEGDYISK